LGLLTKAEQLRMPQRYLEFQIEPLRNTLRNMGIKNPDQYLSTMQRSSNGYVSIPIPSFRDQSAESAE